MSVSVEPVLHTPSGAPPPTSPATAGRPAGRARRTRLAIGALVGVAAGAGILVAHDGRLGWALVRLAFVVAVVAVALVSILGGGQARAVAALVVAIVAVPVGVGIAVPHVSKSGLTAMAAAGVLTLAGGLVLLAVGVADVWARLPRRLVAIPVVGAIAVVLLVMTWTLGQAVAATNVPRPSVGSATPADRGLAYRDVEFAAADGVRLSGWYVPSRTGAAVVLLHGAGSTRSSVLDHAVVLAQHGYGVLLPDARGHGRSGGRAMDFGWDGDADIAGAVAFLEQQADVDGARIAAVGMSMGGEEAIGAAATMPAIRAVVAEGATNRVAGDKDWLSDEFGVRGLLSEGVEWLTYGFADLLTDARPPITLHDAVRAAAPRPVLLIAAGDVADEPRAAAWIQSASPGTVSVWVVPETGHTDALDTHPAEWAQRVTAFLDTALRPDAG